MQRSRTSNGLIAAGVVVLIVGLLTAAGLWYSAGQRRDDAVRNLARAPIGCVTTLDFAEPGRYLLFFETRGEIGDIVGDCGEAGEFEWTGASPPSTTVTLTDPEGRPVGFDSVGGISYDAAGSSGSAVQQFSVDTPGDHLMTVDAAPEGFAVAVGRDPNDGVALLRAGAALALAAGVVIGGAMFVLAARRTPVPPGPPAGSWLHAPPGAAPGAAAHPGWQPVTRPPTRPPSGPIPGQPPFGGGAPGAAGWVTPPTAPPPARPGVAPPVAGPRSPSETPRFDTDDTQPVPRADGSSGDGEPSPWAPPDEERP